MKSRERLNESYLMHMHQTVRDSTLRTWYDIFAFYPDFPRALRGTESTFEYRKYILRSLEPKSIDSLTIRTDEKSRVMRHYAGGAKGSVLDRVILG